MESSELLTTLASYVPVAILQQLQTRPALPVIQAHTAAVLYAEIDGLATLTTLLAQRGAEGTDKLTRMLHTYFWQLVDEVTTYGGDIIKITGDSLLAFWPTAEGDSAGHLTTLTHRAAQCGLSLHKRLADLADTTEIQPRLRISIATGALATLSVGGALGRWEFVASGASVVQVRALIQQAQFGEVLLTPSAYAAVQTQCLGQVLPDGSFQLTDVRFPLPPPPRSASLLSPALDQALRTFIPGAILNRLPDKQIDWLAEVCPLTVLAINLPEITYATPLEQIQAAMRTMQRALYRHAGSISALSIDERGMVLIAALGVPPLAHGDDPARGLQVATMAQTELRQQGFATVIGVATGTAFCGSLGNPHRRVYTLIGECLVRARAIMQASAPEAASAPPIYCDADTYTAARGQMDITTVPVAEYQCKESLP